MASERNFYDDLDKQIKEELQRRLKGCAQGMQGFTVPDYGSCAKISNNICGTYMNPTKSEKNVYEIKIESLTNLNDKLLSEKQKNILQIQALQNEVRILEVMLDKEKNYKYKIKKEKKKDFDVALYDFFNKIGIGVKTLYQDIINWFNT